MHSGGKQQAAAQVEKKQNSNYQGELQEKGKEVSSYGDIVLCFTQCPQSTQ